MNFWAKIGIWIVWLALVVWWLTPGTLQVVDKIEMHNVQIEKLEKEINNE